MWSDLLRVAALTLIRRMAGIVFPFGIVEIADAVHVAGVADGGVPHVGAKRRSADRYSLTAGWRPCLDVEAVVVDRIVRRHGQGFPSGNIRFGNRTVQRSGELYAGISAALVGHADAVIVAGAGTVAVYNPGVAVPVYRNVRPGTAGYSIVNGEYLNIGSSIGNVADIGSVLGIVYTTLL